VLVLVAALCSCLPRSGTDVVIRIENDGRGAPPQHLLFSWLECRSFLIRDQRVPEIGELSAGASPLASVIVRMDTAERTRRGILVRAIVDGAAVATAMAVMDIRPGATNETTVVLTTGSQPDQIADGVPDALDWCATSAPPGDAGTGGGADLPEGGVRDARGVPDAGSIPDTSEAGRSDRPADTAPANAAPLVSAGPDQTAPTPATEIMLAGTVRDDGLPNPPGRLALAWSQVSGPGPATFSAPTLPATRARFPGPGVYVLRLSADDGALTGRADVIATVLSLDGGIAGIWHFDEATGTTFADGSGAGNDATLLAGAGRAAGRLGPGALDCVGTGVQAIVADALNERLDFGAGDFTVSAWMRTTQTRGPGDMVVKWPQTGTAGPRNGFDLGVLSAGVSLFKAYSDGQPSIQVTGPPVNDGQWHHLVGRKTPGALTLFVDGRLAGMRPHALTSVSNDEPLQLGGFGTGGNFDFDGQLDEVILYSRSLSDQEIAALAAGLGP
jgi:Concanavalin A-like lectin/glucanases superfamily